MKIAIVRGAFLNPFENQLYAPLAKQHELLLVGADWQFYNNPFDLDGATLTQPRLWGSALQHLSPRALIAANRLLSWTTGRSFGLCNLENHTGRLDVIHAAEVFFTMSYQSLVVSRHQTIPLIVTVSENLPHMGETHPVRRTRKRTVMAAAARLIAITETAKRSLIAEGAAPEKIEVIPWSLDLSRFRPGPRNATLQHQLGLTPADLVVLFVGRFVPEKGLLELLQAIPRLLTTHSQERLRFVFVGRGPLLSLLERAQRRWPEVVRISPFLPYSQMPEIHRLADIFVLPSRPAHKVAEQFGFVLIESMASAVPVIATRVGSIPDVVGDAADLVPPGDAAALTQSLSMLIADKSRRVELGRKGLERVQQRFDARQNAGRLNAIYEEVCQDTRRRPA